MARKAPAEDPLVTPEELATELRIEKSTLYVWRMRGQGPEGFKANGLLRYRRSEINRWLAESGDTATAATA